MGRLKEEKSTNQKSFDMGLSPDNLGKIMVWSEILGKPVCRRKERAYGNQSNAGRR